jgi:integrase
VHVDRGFVMDFRAKRVASGVSVATVDKDLRRIKSSLSYATDAGWLRSKPLWRWKSMQLREPEKRVRVLELSEFRTLLNACNDPVFRVLLIVGYYGGLRRTELVNLRWSAVDFKIGVLRVENVVTAGELTKSRKNRVLPMHATVRKELGALYADVAKVVEGGQRRPKFPHVFAWPSGKPFRADWTTHEFGRLVKEAGIDHCSVHDLRRSFSALAQRAGVDKATVKDLGGWSTVGVVEKHYSGEVPEVFERAMEKIQHAQGVA